MNSGNQNPHLVHAPITEAIIELRFQKVDRSTFKTLEEISADLKAQYPKKEIKGEKQITFDLKKSGIASVEDFGPSWILLKSQDDRKVVQLKQDRYAFSYVNSYDKWEVFEEEAGKIWWTINKKIKFERVTRVGVRFVNNLRLPKTMSDLREYLQVTPTVPPNLSEVVISSFANKTAMLNPKISAGATLSVALNQTGGATDNFPVILDIDVYKNIEMKNDTTELSNALQDLRKYKNEIFFNCLTQKAKDFYNE